MPLPQEVVAALPEGYRDHAIVKEAADVASVVKMAIDGQKELGSRIRVPGPDADANAISAFHKDLSTKVKGLTIIPDDKATDEQRATFWQQVGRPKDAKSYAIDKIKIPEGLPEKFEIPAAQLDQFRDFAFKNNYTQMQFASALEAELTSHATAHKAGQTALNERNAKLKEKFGAAEEAKRNAALRAAEKFGGAEFKAQLEAHGTPEQWAAWATAGETFSESGSLDLTGKGPQMGALSPDEATRRINEVWANREHAYHKQSRPGHDDAVFEMFNLNLQRSGQRALTRAQYDQQFGRRGHGGKFSATQLGATVAEVGG